MTDLIAVSAHGFDSEGWPLPAQILTCQAVAETYHMAADKPLILTSGGMSPSFYRPQDPVLDGPVLQSVQSAVMLMNMGVPVDDIVTAGVAHDTIGDAIEVYALVADKAGFAATPAYAWLSQFNDLPPVCWTPRAEAFNRAARGEDRHLSVTFAAMDYHAPRFQAFGMHLLRLAGVDVTGTTLAVATPEDLFVSVNGHASGAAFALHGQRSIDVFNDTYGRTRSFDEFFTMLREKHGLYARDKAPSHTDLARAKVTPHDQRPDLAGRPYRIGGVGGFGLTDVFCKSSTAMDQVRKLSTARADLSGLAQAASPV